jgi:hypothetical protein
MTTGLRSSPSSVDPDTPASQILRQPSFSPSTDREAQVGFEPPPEVALFDPAGVGLGVDDPDTGGGHG